MLNCIKIEKKKIIANLNRIKSTTPLICVVKDDAYGLGIENIMPILYDEGERYFAVAFFEEAQELKKIYKDLKIIILNYTENENLKKAAEENFEVSVFNMGQLLDYVKTLESEISKLKIHIKFNTGMNRLGFDAEETEELAKIINENNISVKSVFSHISNSENVENTENQILRFENILNKLEKYKIKYDFKHISASPALFKYKGKYNFDYSRVGMAVYGLEPLNENIGLEKCISLESKIINIRNVKKGEYISYGERNKMKRDSKIGIIPIGYAQGIQMQIEATDACVLIKGEKAPVIGEVCMDMMMIDLTDIENPELLDIVTLIGKQGYNEISLRDISKWTRTIQDDIITKISKKIKRIIT